MRLLTEEEIYNIKVGDVVYDSLYEKGWVVWRNPLITEDDKKAIAKICLGRFYCAESEEELAIVTLSGIVKDSKYEDYE